MEYISPRANVLSLNLSDNVLLATSYGGQNEAGIMAIETDNGGW